MAMTTAGAGYVRFRAAAAKDGRVVPSSIPEPLLEDALPGGPAPWQNDRVKAVVDQIILRALSVALVSLVATFTALLLGWPTAVVVTLLATAITIEIACWALLLCTFAERSRAMLATILLPRKRRKSPEAEKIRQEHDVAREVPSVVGGGNSCVAV